MIKTLLALSVLSLTAMARVQPGTVPQAIEPPAGAWRKPAMSEPLEPSESKRQRVSKKTYLLIGGAVAGAVFGRWLAVRGGTAAGAPVVVPGSPLVGGPR